MEWYYKILILKSVLSISLFVVAMEYPAESNLPSLSSFMDDIAILPKDEQNEALKKVIKLLNKRIDEEEKIKRFLNSEEKSDIIDNLALRRREIIIKILDHSAHVHVTGNKTNFPIKLLFEKQENTEAQTVPYDPLFNDDMFHDPLGAYQEIFKPTFTDPLADLLGEQRKGQDDSGLFHERSFLRTRPKASSLRFAEEFGEKEALFTNDVDWRLEEAEPSEREHKEHAAWYEELPELRELSWEEDPEGDESSLNRSNNQNITKHKRDIGDEALEILEPTFTDPLAQSCQRDDKIALKHAFAEKPFSPTAVRKLISKGVSIFSLGDDLHPKLRWLLEQNHLPLVELFIKKGAPINEWYPMVKYHDGTSSRSRDSMQLLHWAVRRFEVAAVALLLKHGADIGNACGEEWSDWNQNDPGRMTPLMIAADRGHLNIVQLLVKHHADPNKDSGGMYPVSSALSKRHFQVAEWLIQHGTTSHVVTQSMLWAVRRGDLNLVQWLSDHDADVNARDSRSWQDWQAIHYAAEGGHQTIVDWLIKNGADVNARDSRGWQAIHHAANKGHQTIVDLLIKKGADINSITNEKMRPLDIAKKAGKNGLAEWIKSKGGRGNSIMSKFLW